MEAVVKRATPTELALLRLVAEQGGSLHRDGISWRDQGPRGERGLPKLSPSTVTRVTRRMIDSGLLDEVTERTHTSAVVTFAVASPAGLRELRDPPPNRELDSRRGLMMFDSFHAGGGLCWVRQGDRPGEVSIGTGFGAPLSRAQARRLALAILDAVEWVDEPNQPG